MEDGDPLPSKEDAVLGETLDSGGILLDALRARPEDEAPWPALRQREKNVRVANDLRPEVARRLKGAGRVDLAAAAIIGATFACVDAAVWAWVHDDPPPPLHALLECATGVVGANA